MSLQRHYNHSVVTAFSDCKHPPSFLSELPGCPLSLPSPSNPSRQNASALPPSPPPQKSSPPTGADSCRASTPPSSSYPFSHSATQSAHRLSCSGPAGAAVWVAAIHPLSSLAHCLFGITSTVWLIPSTTITSSLPPSSLLLIQLFLTLILHSNHTPSQVWNLPNF